jgi:hypothetical protein
MPFMRLANQLFCMSLSPIHSLVYCEVGIGTFNAAHFDGFLNRLAIDVNQFEMPNPSYVLDSCLIHKEHDLANLCIAHKHGYSYISSYSPGPRMDIFQWRFIIISHKDDIDDKSS